MLRAWQNESTFGKLHDHVSNVAAQNVAMATALELIVTRSNRRLKIEVTARQKSYFRSVVSASPTVISALGTQ